MFKIRSKNALKLPRDSFIAGLFVKQNWIWESCKFEYIFRKEVLILLIEMVKLLKNLLIFSPYILLMRKSKISLYQT